MCVRFYVFITARSDHERLFALQAQTTTDATTNAPTGRGEQLALIGDLGPEILQTLSAIREAGADLNKELNLKLALTIKDIERDNPAVRRFLARFPQFRAHRSSPLIPLAGWRHHGFAAARRCPRAQRASGGSGPQQRRRAEP